MNTEQQHIVIIDDEEEVRGSLSWFIQSMGYVVSSYSDPVNFLEKGLNQAITCLIADVRMPNMTGLELQEELQRRKIKTPLILITGHGDIAMAVRAIKNGALEFLTKPVNNQQLLEAIHQAIKLDTVIKQQQAAVLELKQRCQSLTKREHQVMDLMTQGLSTKEIAKEFNLSTNTVELHRSSVLKKMQIKTTIELVRLHHELNNIFSERVCGP